MSDSSSVATTPSAAVAASDRAILDAVVAALTSDPTLQGAQLNVTVSGGVVTLSGTAQSTAQADRAESVAATAAGTGRVNNKLGSDSN